LLDVLQAPASTKSTVMAHLRETVEELHHSRLQTKQLMEESLQKSITMRDLRRALG
jgi:hypothetical protein